MWKYYNVFLLRFDYLQRTVSGGNADYEQEKKEEKEKHERAIGLLKYLGEGSAESQSK